MSNQASYTHSAGQSNVGAPNIYGNDDQRNIPEAEVKKVSRESGHNLRGHMADQHSTVPSTQLSLGATLTGSKNRKRSRWLSSFRKKGSVMSCSGEVRRVVADGYPGEDASHHRERPLKEGPDSSCMSCLSF